jgi:HEAT repeat protein
MNDPLLADPLFKLVSTSEGILRFDAAIALARLGDDRAIATLREALNFPDEGIRLEVARLLEKLETN